MCITCKDLKHSQTLNAICDEKQKYLKFVDLPILVILIVKSFIISLKQHNINS